LAADSSAYSAGQGGRSEGEDATNMRLRRSASDYGWLGHLLFSNASCGCQLHKRPAISFSYGRGCDALLLHLSHNTSCRVPTQSLDIWPPQYGRTIQPSPLRCLECTRHAGRLAASLMGRDDALASIRGPQCSMIPSSRPPSPTATSPIRRHPYMAMEMHAGLLS
jgi:hypothetical protein